nr:M20/M25/M40 family metallo-hydrolase [Dehalococcoidales bacterium]
RILVDGLMEHVAPPTEKDWAYMRSIPFDEENLKAKFGITRFSKDLHGLDLLKKHLYEPTCTICGLESGYIGEGTKTVLPAEASAKVDFRLVPDLTPGLVERVLREHLDRRGFADVEIIPSAGMMPAKSPLDAPIVEKAVETAREVYGVEPIVYPLMAGSGPMYGLCQGLGLPAVAAGVANTRSNEHAPDENIRLADYFRGLKFVGHLISALGADGDEKS